MLSPVGAGAQGQVEFDTASRRAFLGELAAVLTGRGRSLLPLREVMRAARMEGQVDRGVREIPLDRIRGSEGRQGDFDASFMPLKEHLRERWIRLYNEVQMGRELPPIEVYQVGEVYFVKDGHHRVSVARYLGWPVIRAHVVEVRTRAPLDPDIDPEELLKVAEYRSFLERTQLDRVRPEARLDCSHLGRYDVIFEHIQGHRYFLGLERGREVSIPEAAASWYDSVYRPVMEVARRHRIQEQLPDWTEADIYLALTELWLDLEEEGRPAGPHPAAHALLADVRSRRRSRRRTAARAGDKRRRRRGPGRRARVAGRVLRAIRGARGASHRAPGPEGGGAA